ncbi:Hsp70 family protein [Actinoplanes sp. NPDC026670]|uniref:Hsp70 family protein n=1 Tax=Actinoplanes sp. NPDC026670 TaxID=3154700 RepID=UPI0033D6F4EE
MSSDFDGPRLVIDVGHSATTVLLLTADRMQLLTEPLTGAPAWPSALFRDGEQLLTGAAAQERRSADPGSAAAGWTRGLAADELYLLGGRPFRAGELFAALLNALRREAERVTGTPVTRALLTVPAGGGDHETRRARTLAAAEAAGFTTVESLDEPTAAAHVLAAGAGLPEGDLALMYGLGGGSFDATLVRLGWPASHIVEHVRLGDCGAADIDVLVGRQVAASNRQWLTPPAGDEAAALRLNAAVTDFAQRIRHQLSDAAATEDFLMPGAPAYRLTRPGLAALAAPVLHRTVLACRQLLARHGVPATRLAAILLTGGGTRMPAVVEMLAAEFGRPLRRIDEPELAVVRGAARWSLVSGPRLVPAVTGAERLTPLVFTVPGGAAQLQRWLVEPGQAYASGQTLGRIRLPGGALWDLTAATGGRLERTLSGPGAQVVSGQWLALVDR